MQLKKDKKTKAWAVLIKKRDAWMGLLEKGVNVSDARMAELEGLRDQATNRRSALKHVFAFNFKSTMLNEERYVTFHEINRGTKDSDEGADYEKLKRVLKHEFKEFGVEALVVDVSEFVNDFDRTLLAAATMMRIPMVVVCSDPALHDDINQATGGVWRICTTEKELKQYLENDLPGVIATVRSISADVAGRVEKYKHVNKLQHGLKRGAVAFVPLGVYAVNFLGIARLVRRMLKKTGMLNDAEAKKAATVEAAVTGIKVNLIDATGDIYQFTITATLLAGFATEVSAAGLEAGLASLTALDFALLGSITVVTGTVSAIGAYIARPKMVEAIANLIAVLQVVCLLNPALRRKDTKELHSAGSTAAAGEPASTSAGTSAGASKQVAASKSMLVQARKASSEATYTDGGIGTEVDNLADLADSDSGPEDPEAELVPLHSAAAAMADLAPAGTATGEAPAGGAAAAAAGAPYQGQLPLPK